MDIIRDVRRVGMLMKIGADRREQAQKSKKPARKQAFLNLAPLTGIAFASNWLINKLNLKTLPVKTTRMTTNQN
ncbi:hypothetical protein [Klebsiella aerogenes]|uniref:hypothetical protein n=1 Tax=Klebsiella aerogenes TaxID=548 RepID=UPI0015DDB2F0|nr:hypothetical protein [Klebsiella aerogenes]